MPNEKDNSVKVISKVMIFMLLGKVLGIVRDALLAVHYGTGVEANAFYAASRIPRVFFDAIFASAISACFIPVFSERLTKKGKKSAFQFGNVFLSLVGLATALLSLVGIAFSAQFVTLIADGFDAETTALAADLMRILFFSVFFTGVAFSFVGILQSLDHFNIPAVISAVSNLVVILYFLVFDEHFGIYGLAVAYLFGWFLQAAVQLPSLRREGWRFRPSFHLKTAGLKQVFALLPPVMVATWVQPISLTINSKFGSRLYDGAGLSAIEISTNLYIVISGVLVSSVTNVIFPKLSRLSSSGEEQAFTDTLRQTLRSVLFLVLPMSIGLMVVARPLIGFVYGGGAFDAFSIDITAEGLRWVSLGMAGYAVQNIVSRAYFARQEGRVPLIAGGISIAANIVLCSLLTPAFEIKGLALSGALSSMIYALILLLCMHGRLGNLLTGDLLLSLLRMALASGVMLLCTTGVLNLTAGLLPGKSGYLLTLAVTTLLGCVVYFLAAFLLRIEEAKQLFSTVTQKIKRG